MGRVWVSTSDRLFLLNVIRDIVPAFPTRKVESCIFIFLPGFGNLQISTNYGSILWSLEPFSEIIAMKFRTELVQM